MYGINQNEVMSKVMLMIEERKDVEISLSEYMSLNEQNRQLIYNYLKQKEVFYPIAESIIIDQIEEDLREGGLINE